MSDTVVTVLAIFLAAILMFIFPLMSMADRTDDISLLAVQTATTEFVEEVGTTGSTSSTITMYRTSADGNYTLTEDVHLHVVVKGKTIS